MTYTQPFKYVCIYYTQDCEMSSESIRTNDHGKTRVNLGIDSQILKRAKAAGINISAHTEEFLRFLTYEDNTVEDIAKAYESFFQAIQPILKKYNGVVKVGEFFGTFYSIMQRLPKENFDSSDYSLILNSDALFISKDDQLYSIDIDLPSYLTEGVVYLDEPKLILNNLLLALTEGSRNK